MPLNEKCEYGKLKVSSSCHGLINEYESFHKKCSLNTCKKYFMHTHRLCNACEAIFNERKEQLKKR